MNALLFNAPHDTSSLMEFSSIHQADHLEIQSQMFQKLNLGTIILPPLDPIPVQFDLLTWLMYHQFAHNQVNGYLNLSGYDLTSVDFHNHEQLLIWTRYNALEHYAMTQALALIQPQASQ